MVAGTHDGVGIVGAQRLGDNAGGKGRLSDKAVLASAGLMSAAISAYKNWA